MATQPNPTLDRRYHLRAAVVKFIVKFVVITTSKSHSYIITMANGERIKVNWLYRNEEQLGNFIEQMWVKNAIARRAQQIQQHHSDTEGPSAI